MTTPKLTQAQLKKQLENYSPKELIAEIGELYRRFPDVKNYYQIKLSPQSEGDIVSEYKEKIKKEFFPTRGLGRARLSIAKKPISEYKKVCFNPTSLIDLMLFYVEQGVDFSNEYGDIGEAFYASMESMFYQALNLIQETNSYDIFYSRCRLIVNNASGTGYGFYDQIEDGFSEAYKGRSPR